MNWRQKLGEIREHLRLKELAYARGSWRAVRRLFSRVSDWIVLTVRKHWLATMTVIGIAVAAIVYRRAGLDTFLPILADMVPLLIAVVGIIMSYKQPKKESHLYTTMALILAGLAGSGVISWNRIRTEHAHTRETTTLNGKIDRVGEQNQSILQRVLAAPAAVAEDAQVMRRRNILELLRNEYILAHDNISPGIMAGTEYPPSEWINKRLRELGEKWIFKAQTLPVAPTIIPPAMNGPQQPCYMASSDKPFSTCSAEQVLDWAQPFVKNVRNILLDFSKARYEIEMRSRQMNDEQRKEHQVEWSQDIHYARWDMLVKYRRCCQEPAAQLRDSMIAWLEPGTAKELPNDYAKIKTSDFRDRFADLYLLSIETDLEELTKKLRMKLKPLPFER